MTAVLRAEEPSARYLVEVEPTLTRGFELLVTAPSGIARLRDLICSLAVRGKLLPQEPFDQPAANLIAPLRRERTRLVEAGRIRKECDADAGEAIQLDFELPIGWKAVRLADVAWPQAGFAFKSSAFNAAGRGLPLIRIRDIGANSPTIHFSGEFREEFIVRLGDWLIGMDGDFRVAQWTGPDALLNQRVTRLVFFGDEIERLYITLALQIELRKLQGTKAYTTVDHLSGSQIASRIIALPPLAEQHRIVARVEELMKLCDALEQNGRLADEQHARLTFTLFDALAASESAHALAENWQRIAEHFDLLLDRPEAIDSLEQVILQLAVHGLLVQQLETDESAATLLDRIRTERDREIAIGNLKRDKALPAVGDDEHPFRLPEGWCWTRLGAAGVTSTGGTPPTGRTDYSGTDVAYVKPGSLSSTGVTYAEEGLSESGAKLIGVVEPPSVLMVCIGGSIGKVALATRRCAFNQQINAVWPLLPMMAAYLLIALSSSDFQLQVLGKAGTSTLPIISKGKWEQLLIPMPPLAEQRRIVARVAELRRLCADLRQRLTQTRQIQASLADALVAEVA